ncbi:hypothetical protein R1flu_010340 [Riccia fluitans]|uniref:Uncharacterized protein n=1 Tax=Riccia fluitans TaxID=41844 RepID=A0ABD1Z5L7_9MARC
MTKQTDSLEEGVVINPPRRSWPLFNLGAKPFSKGEKSSNDKSALENKDGIKFGDKKVGPIIIREVGESFGDKVMPERGSKILPQGKMVLNETIFVQVLSSNVITNQEDTMALREICEESNAPKEETKELTPITMELIAQKVLIEIMRARNGSPQEAAIRKVQELEIDLELEMMRATIANNQTLRTPDAINIMEVIDPKEQKAGDEWKRTWRENVCLIDKMTWPEKI